MKPTHESGSSPHSSRWSARVAEMDLRWYRWNSSGEAPEELAAALGERVKELNCLYAISQLAERENSTLEDFLGLVVDVLPPSWQYPEIACARIVLGELECESLHFAPSRWRLNAPIREGSDIVGEVVVYYGEERPRSDEGPFLKEERYLIDAVAERISHVSSRLDAETKVEEFNRQLETERIALREANRTLRVVLNRIEEEKEEIQRNIQENVNRVLLPIVHALDLEASPEQHGYIALLKENLEHVVSPFVRRLSRAHQSLTPTEIKICDMIRGGLGSKEIARLRSVSISTISRHREHIRRKLGIANEKANLTTYLQKIM